MIATVSGEGEVHKEDNVTSALKWLKVRYRINQDQLAVLGLCSKRHIQSVLSESDKTTLMDTSKYTLARFFKVDPTWFDKLGKALNEGGSIDEFEKHLDSLKIFLPIKDEDGSWRPGLSAFKNPDDIITVHQPADKAINAEGAAHFPLFEGDGDASNNYMTQTRVTPAKQGDTITTELTWSESTLIGMLRLHKKDDTFIKELIKIVMEPDTSK